MSKELETLRWQTKSLDSYEKEIFKAINTTDSDHLPFKLPREIRWPIGVKDKSDRAMILLRAGYEALKEKYPFKEVLSENAPHPKKDVKTGANELDGWH